MNGRKLREVSLRFLSVLLISSLLTMFVITGFASAQPTVTRELPATVVPGEVFDVVITWATPCDDFNGIGLTDVAPTGWTVNVNKTWCNPEADSANIPVPSTIQYMWTGEPDCPTCPAPYSIGDPFTALYTVQVPADAALGLYTFPDGTLEYFCGTTGPTTVNITGDTTVVVPPPTEVWVDDGWTGYSPGDPADGHTFGYDAFATIQEGIGAVTSSTVNVLPGTYTEDIVIPADKDNLELEGASGATIKGVATTAIWPGGPNNIEILADGVKIHGFTIQGPDRVPTECSLGMVIGGDNVEIYDNAFEVTPADTFDEISQAIQTCRDANNPTGGDVDGLNIHDNTFAALADSIAGYEGIYINHTLSDPAPSGNVTIADNTFTGKVLRAITTERSKTTISGNTIITDLLSGDSLALGYGYIGILVRDYDARAQDNVQITGNTIKGSAEGNGFVDGMRIGTSGQTLTNIVVANNVVQMGDTGIEVRCSVGGLDVDSNTISGNIGDGILISEVSGSDIVDISNNTISDNDGDGILISEVSGDGSVDITDNTISGNTDDGIDLGFVGEVVPTSPQVNISCNTISGNGDDGVYISSMSEDYLVTVSSCNDIFDNEGYGVYNDSDYMVDATDNWWGDVLGPGGEGPGSGDEVSENVDYEPWLLAPCGEEEEVVEEEVVEEVAPGPSRFSHRNLNVSPVQTYSNQPVTISMVVANTGESRGSVQINLTINGTIEQSKRITIDSGSSKRLEFTVMKLDPGTYDFYVGRLQGQFHVIATAAFVPPPPPPSPLPAIPDTTGQLGTGGIIAIVIIGIMVIGGLTVAFMMTRRA